MFLLLLQTTVVQNYSYYISIVKFQCVQLDPESATLYFCVISTSHSGAASGDVIFFFFTFFLCCFTWDDDVKCKESRGSGTSSTEICEKPQVNHDLKAFIEGENEREIPEASTVCCSW